MLRAERRERSSTRGLGDAKEVHTPGASTTCDGVSFIKGPTCRWRPYLVRWFTLPLYFLRSRGFSGATSCATTLGLLAAPNSRIKSLVNKLRSESAEICVFFSINYHAWAGSQTEWNTSHKFMKSRLLAWGQVSFASLAAPSI